MSSSRKSWKKALLAAGAAGILAAPMVTSTASAETAATVATDGAPGTVDVIATGLKNGRGVTPLWNGDILVAESGEGQPGCAVNVQCAGPTGSILRVRNGVSTRVVTGLDSVAAGAAPGAPVVGSGPNNVVPSPDGNGYVVISTFGGYRNTAGRDALGANAKTLGTVFRTSDKKVLGDLVKHETDLNPDGGDINANGFNFTKSGSSILATDAAANDIIRISPDGSAPISTAFVLPKNHLPNGTDAEAVPTGAVTDWNGDIYVADMSGGNVGAARIWKIEPGKQPQVLVSGLTNLIDISFDWDGGLIALSYSDTSINGAPGASRLYKINTWTKSVNEIPTGGNLKQATGLGVSIWGDIYVTNNSVGTNGQLVKVNR
ncbi:ScyD/ScyE family protein [Streptomyces sp. NPDC089919]|uniref:ScyD/ScyE family protein n=1 Tax=Streptomyces sp. NPDC089919 TaxID=3155188 RepID=UPI0034187C9F